MINNDYVSFEQAKAINELGFDWWVTQYYEREDLLWFPECGECTFTDIEAGRYSAPTLYQAKKWLYENFAVVVEATAFIACNHKIMFQPILWINDNQYSIVPVCKKYELALNISINKALEYLKENLKLNQKIADGKK